MNIGHWVRRVYEGKRYRTTKWHLIESVIDDEPITRCGRRMDRHTLAGSANRLETVETEPLTRMIGQPQNCSRCSRG
jgi:hypothetical protein